jgi:hypothetical protein
MMNAYLEREKQPGTNQFHPLLSGFEESTRVGMAFIAQ